MLRVSPALPLLVVAGFFLSAAGCSDDITTIPPDLSAGTTGGMGGMGGSVTTVTTGGAGGTGGVGGTTDGGGGTLPLTGEDLCPGEVFQVNAGDTLTLHGDTMEAADDYYDDACMGGVPSGPDVVYQFDLQQPGTFKLNVVPSAGSLINPGIYLASQPLGSNDTAVCENFGEFGNFVGCATFGLAENFDYGFNEPTTVHVIVDGQSATAGTYDLTLSYNAAMCGDGVVNAGEECDDANDVDPADGCHACVFVLNTVFDTCPGEAETVMQVGEVKFIDGTTTPYTDNYTAVAGDACGAAPPGGGKDRVYQIDIPDGVSGVLEAVVGLNADSSDPCDNGIDDPQCWDRVLLAYGPAGCGVPAEQIACSDLGFLNVEQISFPVVGPATYYVVVDGYYFTPDSYGGYTMRLELLP